MDLLEDRLLALKLSRLQHRRNFLRLLFAIDSNVNDSDIPHGIRRVTGVSELVRVLVQFL